MFLLQFPTYNIPMKFTDYLTNIKGYTPMTAKTYSKYEKMLQECNNDYGCVLNQLSQCNNNTKRVALSACKAYYTWINDRRLEEISLPKKVKKVLEHITNDEYRFLLNKYKMNSSHNKTKKRIIIRLLFETGIRSSELLNLKKEDVDNNKLKIKGKGNRERIVFASEWLSDELHTYLETITSNKLFDFTYKNLHKLLHNTLPNKSISPHMFRRGYAKYLNSKGVEIYDISISMGHSNINTTASYINKDSSSVNLSKIFNM